MKIQIPLNSAVIHFAKLLLPEGRHILNHTEIITWFLVVFPEVGSEI